MILLLFFSQWTPLHYSACEGRLEVARLLVESKADVAARRRCFSPPPSHHRSLTICLAALAAGLHSTWPSATTKPRLLHTCAASARRNDAHPPRCRCPNKSSSCSCRRGGSCSVQRAADDNFLRPGPLLPDLLPLLHGESIDAESAGRLSHLSSIDRHGDDAPTSHRGAGAALKGEA